MKSPLIIAVSQRVDHLTDRGETRDSLDQKLTSWLKAVGALPAPVPNSIGDGDGDGDSIVAWLKHTGVRGVLLSGGNDIGQFPERDRTERALMKWAEAHCLPVLGICRGMQMLATEAGASLVQVEGHVRTRHTLHAEVEKDSFPVEVNSYHAWGMQECPKEYQVLVRSPDKLIEGIRHRQLPWEGWMWHPEREATFSPLEVRRAKVIFGA